jgi:hypothetical protein
MHPIPLGQEAGVWCTTGLVVSDCLWCGQGDIKRDPDGYSDEFKLQVRYIVAPYASSTGEVRTLPSAPPCCCSTATTRPRWTSST